MEIAELRDGLVRGCIDDAREAAKRASSEFGDADEEAVRTVAIVGANMCLVVAAGGTGNELLAKTEASFRGMKSRGVNETQVLDQVLSSLRNRMLAPIRVLLDANQRAKPAAVPSTSPA